MGYYRHDHLSRQGKLFQGLKRLENIRITEPCFDTNADVQVVDSEDKRVLALCRRSAGRELICLFNFSSDFVRVDINRVGGYTELMYGVKYNDIHFFTGMTQVYI